MLVETSCVCISSPKDQQEQNIDPRPNIIISYTDINEECNKLKNVFQKNLEVSKQLFLWKLTPIKMKGYSQQKTLQKLSKEMKMQNKKYKKDKKKKAKGKQEKQKSLHFLVTS